MPPNLSLRTVEMQIHRGCRNDSRFFTLCNLDNIQQKSVMIGHSLLTYQSTASSWWDVVWHWSVWRNNPVQPASCSRLQPSTPPDPPTWPPEGFLGDSLFLGLQIEDPWKEVYMNYSIPVYTHRTDAVSRSSRYSGW